MFSEYMTSVCVCLFSSLGLCGMAGVRVLRCVVVVPGVVVGLCVRQMDE